MVRKAVGRHYRTGRNDFEVSSNPAPQHRRAPADAMEHVFSAKALLGFLSPAPWRPPVQDILVRSYVFAPHSNSSKDSLSALRISTAPSAMAGEETEIVFGVVRQQGGGFVADCLSEDIIAEGDSWENSAITFDKG